MDIIPPSTHDLGAFEVRRTLPNKARKPLGATVAAAAFVATSLDRVGLSAMAKAGSIKLSAGLA